MLKEEKRITVSLGKREVLLFSIALLITYGLVFAFGVEFGKSWMRSLLESQEIAATATPAAPEAPPAVEVQKPSQPQVNKPPAPVIEVRPSAEKPAPAAPKVAEGGEPAVETPQAVAPKVSSQVQQVEREAKKQVEKAVSAAVSTAQKAESAAISTSAEAEQKAVATAKKEKTKVESVTKKAEKSATKKASAAQKSSSRFQKTTVKPHVVGGGYLVQVGAFSKESSAISLVKKLRAKGYHSSMSRVKRGGKTFYKVFVGPYGSQTSARHAIELLKKREKLTGYLVHPKK